MGKIASPSREEDRNIRLTILSAMRIALRTGDLESAKELGEVAKNLSDKIKNYDYTREDAWKSKVKQICKI